MKIKKMCFALFLVIVAYLLFNPNCYAGEQHIRNLDFDVELESDGTMNITEIWDIDVSNTNTLFKTFKYDSELFENVAVSDITGTEKNFEQINRLMYHVTPGCFYGLKNDDGKFEIAWCADLENDSARRKYKISYTVKNSISLYNDCAEMYWQLIGPDFSIKSDHVTGRITLPYDVTNMEDLRVWAHGPLNGNIYKESTNSVKFDIDDLYKNTFLEIRIATPTYVFPGIYNQKNFDKLSSIIREETEWANEANRKRERAKAEQELITKGIFIASIAITVLVVYFTIKNIKKLSILPKKKSKKDIGYFRDIPDENATPSEVAYLYSYMGLPNMSKIVSATILDLCLKGYIKMEQDPENKKELIISIVDKLETLKEDELAVLDYLKAVAKKTKNAENPNSFKMSELVKFSNKYPLKMASVIDEISKMQESREKKDKYYDKKSKSQYLNYAALATLTLIL